ncbi:hypothetical protein BTN49_1092 [Candidatus Enterovibrio escicola]|uniref:Uncharacterized protein n=1 Tax=Candidatus Enterovibrio escicola TaxID=1927127 RepID=A0A2A5T4J9_9GAMM|nr:hypothetical protein BTN49_1092 [Candidatus Enterovibrio escacola]
MFMQGILVWLLIWRNQLTGDTSFFFIHTPEITIAYISIHE